MLLEATLRLRFCSNSVIDVVNWPLGLALQAEILVLAQINCELKLHIYSMREPIVFRSLSSPQQS